MCVFPPSDHNFQSFFNAATIFLPLSEDMGSSHAIKLAPRVGGARWQNSIFLDVDTAPPPTPPAPVFLLLAATLILQNWNSGGKEIPTQPFHI